MTLTDYRSILSRTKSNRAAGIDTIPYEFYRYGPQSLSIVVVQLLNDCLDLLHIPAFWKTNLLTLLPKPDRDPTLTSNYRPITLAPTILKLLESYVNVHVLRYCLKHDILKPTQLAFRPSFSTSDQLLDIVENAVHGFNTAQTTLLLSLDLHKAFDSVSHTLLLNTIQSTIQSTHTTHLITTLLSNRTTYIRHHSLLSDVSFTPSLGVPQGSPLSPTLFNIFLSRLPDPPTPRVKQYVYADDITITSMARNPTFAWRLVAPHLQAITDWIQLFQLQLQPAKTQLMFLTRNTNRMAYPPMHLLGHQLRQSSSVRILGLTFDASLRFTAHFRQLYLTIPPVVARLRSLMQQNPVIPTYVGMLLCRSLIRSRIFYASPLLINLPASTWRRLSQLYHTALRAASRSHRRTPLPTLYRRCHTTDLRTDYTLFCIRQLLKQITEQPSRFLPYLSKQAHILRLTFQHSPLQKIFHLLTLPQQQQIVGLMSALHLDPPP